MHAGFVWSWATTKQILDESLPASREQLAMDIEHTLHIIGTPVEGVPSEVDAA